MDFTHPWMLLLALALPLLLLLMRRSIAGWTPKQRAACLGVRALILLLLVLAIAGWRMRLGSRDLSVVFLVDASASISPEAAEAAKGFLAESLKNKRASDDAALVGFAGEPALWQGAAGPKLDGTWSAPGHAEATDVAAAMRFGAALLSADKHRRIVLLTDGQQTRGDAFKTAGTLAAHGNALQIVPLRNPPKPEVMVESLAGPRLVRDGAKFDLNATLRSSTETRAKYSLYENGFVVDSGTVALTSGTTPLVLQNLVATSNSSTFELELIPEADTRLENNRARAVVTQRGKPRVLVIDSDPARLTPFVSTLNAAGIEVETRPPQGFPISIEDLQACDLLVLSDVPSLAISDATKDVLRRWVQQFGGGFLMTGGENSFGAGGYYKTTFEKLLPVRMEHDDRLDTPSVALLIVLDRSGSMAAQVGPLTKMALACQGAVLAMEVLQSRDLLGVTAVDTRVHQVVPLARIGDKAAISERIRAINSGGGGIYVFTSLLDAWQSMRAVEAKIKHVILFSDAADAEEKAAGQMGDSAPGTGTALDITSAMLAERITTSVVALGTAQDRDAAFLEQLADRGNGRFYLTNDAATLPQIFTSETVKVAQSSLVEEPFMAAPAQSSPLTDGIDWPQSPLLLGYNATKAKPGADVLLTTERGEPLLATWRTGLGQAAAFTSDVFPRWSSEWAAWPGFGKFWTQVVRGLLRQNTDQGLDIQTGEKDGALVIRMDAMTSEGKFRDGLRMEVSVAGEGRESMVVGGTQVAPGRFEATIPMPEAGTSILSVNATTSKTGDAGESAPVTFGYSPGYPKEYRSTDTDEAFLRELAQRAGGVYDMQPADVFARPTSDITRPLGLAPWMLSLALMLIPLDIWLRRRAWSA